MYLYLLHADSQISHAQHYIGITADLLDRLTHHANSQGARLTQVFRERGIEWRCVRVWAVDKHHIERALKNERNGRQFCPICNPPAGRKWAHAAELPLDLFNFPLDSVSLRKESDALEHEQRNDAGAERQGAGNHDCEFHG